MSTLLRKWTYHQEDFPTDLIARVLEMTRPIHATSAINALFDRATMSSVPIPWSAIFIAVMDSVPWSTDLDRSSDEYCKGIFRKMTCLGLSIASRPAILNLLRPCPRPILYEHLAIETLINEHVWLLVYFYVQFLIESTSVENPIGAGLFEAAKGDVWDAMVATVEYASYMVRVETVAAHFDARMHTAIYLSQYVRKWS